MEFWSGAVWKPAVRSSKFSIDFRVLNAQFEHKFYSKGAVMLSESDKNAVIRCAKKYNVASVILFGSTLEANAPARDIDLGVKGIKPELFFKFYGELSRGLSKEVDLVDLSHKSLFNTLVEKNGVKIYG
jgi:predicted nucleotidyltransferase